jgi:hypothetical protein
LTNEIEARQLRAEGVPITTLDGRQLRLVFDMDALLEIEDAFGSLGGMQDALEAMARDQHNAKIIKPIVAMMRAALMHDPTARDARFDPALINEYLGAVMKATDLAFPKENLPGNGPTPTEAGTDISDSRGMGSITSPPSGSGEPMAPSGA